MSMAEDPRQGTIAALEPSQRLPGPSCAHCQAPLTSRRQKRFCSDRCRSAWWEERHPRIGVPLPDPGAAKQAIRVRILGLLMDRDWHTLRDLSMALGVMETTVSAKLRDLRKPQYGAFEIEHRSAAAPYSKRAHEYRLVKA